MHAKHATERPAFWPLMALCLLGCLTAQVRADKVDEFVAAQMREHNLVGLSLAVIEDGKIVKAQGYGFTDKSRGKPVTPLTLFQAGSVSKPVAALGALRLVEQGKLSLDEDVNQRLRTWKVPENEFTQDAKVTLRLILCHSAGLTVHGFPGYGVRAPVPTLVEILDGGKPANTPPIRVDIVPGTKVRYSGGGYTVMQQLMLDVTGLPFPVLLRESVLQPLGMAHSTFEQPLRPELAANTASGYYANGAPVKGRWHVYPEMAAAGLWSTPSDLARFAIGIQDSLAGRTNRVISAEMTREMLRVQGPGDGLGVFITGSGKNRQFSHNGRDEGFDTLMKAGAETRQGAVIMINANDDSQTLNKITEAITREYHWPAGL